MFGVILSSFLLVFIFVNLKIIVNYIVLSEVVWSLLFDECGLFLRLIKYVFWKNW